MKIAIPVVTLYSDCGDGGWNVESYNTQEEMLADHHLVKEAIKEWKTPEELAKIKKLILQEDDPYENGSIAHDTIEIDVDHNTGVARLVKPFFQHFGQ